MVSYVQISPEHSCSVLASHKPLTAVEFSGYRKFSCQKGSVSIAPAQELFLPKLGLCVAEQVANTNDVCLPQLLLQCHPAGVSPWRMEEAACAPLQGWDVDCK